MVTERSETDVATVVVAAAELFPALLSGVAELTVAVLLMLVPAGVAALTCTTSVKFDVDPATTFPLSAVTGPVAPTAGVVVVQPAGAVNETNVVFAGRTSLSETAVASLGPLFVTVRV